MSGYEGDFYEHSLIPNEERLAKIVVNLKPDEPDPPPCAPATQKSRRKFQSSPGDTCLLNAMNPNRPDIALAGGQTVLNTSPSPPSKRYPDKVTSEEQIVEEDVEVEVEESLDERLHREMEERERKRENQVRAMSLFGPNLMRPLTNSPELKEPESIKETTQPAPPMDVTPRHVPRSKPAHSVGLNIDVFAKPEAIVRELQPPQTARFPPTERHEAHRKNSLPPSYKVNTGDYQTTLSQKHDSLLTSPVSQHLRSPPTPRHQLPALQHPSAVSSPQSATSPQTLPKIGPLLDIATKRNTETITRQRGSSLSQTPTFSAQSPSSFPTFSNYASPVDSTASPRDYGSSHPFVPPLNVQFRRRSVAGEHPFAHGLPSASSVSDSHTSPADAAFSPDGTQNGTATTTPSEYSARIGSMYHNTPQTPHQSISSATSPQGPTPNYPHETPILPHPNPHPNKLPIPSTHPTQQLPTPTQYKCQYDNCSAPPFATQYLLNSHTTVHSSDRPHYCPVPGCPRGPGGQGFKRKNEMKRHGLVHDSPGYICPFCPEREHRYPRPDNLQRHVRVHHADIPQNDPRYPRLREVLEKKGMSGRSAALRRKGRSVSLSGGSAMDGINGMNGVGMNGTASASVNASGINGPTVNGPMNGALNHGPTGLGLRPAPSVGV